jgi:hypothetical protein
MSLPAYKTVESIRTPPCTICTDRERQRTLPAMLSNRAYLPVSKNSSKWPPHMYSLPGRPANLCSRVQSEQAGHSVRRWFGLSPSKFSRHLNKSQHSFTPSLIYRSANETQNCGCLIAHCFATLNEAVFPGTPLSLPFMRTYFTLGSLLIK